jgi:hypothetical protein
MKKILFIAILLSRSVCQGQELSCFNLVQDMTIGSLMPYAKIGVGDCEGYFLLDFGTTGSTIDTNAFGICKPRPLQGSVNRFPNFIFFGSWGAVSLNIQDHSNIQGLGQMKQAGIIGTDFLSNNIFLLDYVNAKIYRSDNPMSCNHDSLKIRGFRAASTKGYYSNKINNLNNSCTANIPTIPVKVGNIAAIAQVDAGYDDRLYRHSVNINLAFFNAIKENGILLVENPAANFTLSTCISNVQERVKAYKLPANTSFSITGIDGEPIMIYGDVNIFLKETPESARSCGGIGGWTIPAAQLGTSFLIDSRKVIFDPFGEKVWFLSHN